MTCSCSAPPKSHWPTHRPAACHRHATSRPAGPSRTASFLAVEGRVAIEPPSRARTANGCSAPPLPPATRLGSFFRVSRLKERDTGRWWPSTPSRVSRDGESHTTRMEPGPSPTKAGHDPLTFTSTPALGLTRPSPPIVFAVRSDFDGGRGDPVELTDGGRRREKVAIRDARWGGGRGEVPPAGSPPTAIWENYSGKGRLGCAG